MTHPQASPDGTGAETDEVRRALVSLQSVPYAWGRGFHTPGTPNEPDQWDFEVYPGMDPPDNDERWFPLYRRDPLAASVLSAEIERLTRRVEYERIRADSNYREVMAMSRQTRGDMERYQAAEAALASAAAPDERGHAADAVTGRLSRDRDIIVEAINTYDQWMRDDGLTAYRTLQTIMNRMRERAIRTPDQDTAP